MPRNVTYEYKVRGVGGFPIDMLRYDHAIPATEQDSVQISASLGTHFMGEPARTARIVSLISDFPPTPARWASFGWQVEPGIQTRRKF